eukprot:2160896-Pleurochrysis_carterae.AAC.1
MAAPASVALRRLAGRLCGQLAAPIAAQKAMEQQEPPFKAGAHTESGARISNHEYAVHFHVKLLSVFGVVCLVVALESTIAAQARRLAARLDVWLLTLV